MERTFKIRRRTFWRFFAAVAGVSAAVFLLQNFAVRMEWNAIFPIGAALVLCVFLSLVVALRVERLSRDFSMAIESQSLQYAEQQATELRGTLYEESAAEWQTALRSLQDSCFDKQAEAGQHYATLAELMRMMAKAIDERTSYLRGHSDRVATYSAQIARELGVDAFQVERIRLAALLHDIGTLGVEDSIVRKDTPLTPEEFEIVKAHTVKGAAILRPIKELNDLIPGVELHHESLDGQGYPYGLRGDEIPLMARVIAVADSFDAMTTVRPYQSAMDPEYVLEVLNRLAGKRYDIASVTALATLVKRGDIVARSMRAPVSFPQRDVVSEVV
jgi:putative nucleotidyltransferase with HDIG domain